MTICNIHRIYIVYISYIYRIYIVSYNKLTSLFNDIEYLQQTLHPVSSYFCFTVDISAKEARASTRGECSSGSVKAWCKPCRNVWANLVISWTTIGELISRNAQPIKLDSMDGMRLSQSQFLHIRSSTSAQFERVWMSQLSDFAECNFNGSRSPLSEFCFHHSYERMCNGRCHRVSNPIFVCTLPSDVPQKNPQFNFNSIQFWTFLILDRFVSPPNSDKTN
jgi:hypothetical protein